MACAQEKDCHPSTIHCLFSFFDAPFQKVTNTLCSIYFAHYLRNKIFTLRITYFTPLQFFLLLFFFSFLFFCFFLCDFVTFEVWRDFCNELKDRVRKYLTQHRTRSLLGHCFKGQNVHFFMNGAHF